MDFWRTMCKRRRRWKRKIWYVIKMNWQKYSMLYIRKNTQFYEFLTKISLMKEKWLSSTPNGLDLLSRNAILDCLAKNRKAKDAEKLLSRTETEEGVQPNTVSYNTVINSISKSDDENAADYSLEVLECMEKLHKGENKSSVRPDVFSYTTVINPLSHSKKHGSPQKAEELLKKWLQ